MKTMLILILAVALAAAAFFTRPSKDSFAVYYGSKRPVSEKASPIERVIADSERDAALKTYAFKDMYLWVEMTKDDKTQYIGAFSHWFDKTEPTATPQPAIPAK